MYNKLLIAVGAVLVSASSQAAAPTADVRSAVEQLVGRVDAAWDAGDAAALAAQYTSDGTLRSASTPTADLAGPNAIRGFFEKSFVGRPKGLRHVSSVETVELLTPGLALADVSVRVEHRAADGSWKPVAAFQNNSIAMRQGSVWKLRAVRVYAQPAAASFGAK